MRIETALNNAFKVHSKLKKLGGIISTPECRHTAFIIRRAWVFGSLAKGSKQPNDIDILFDCRAYMFAPQDDNLRKYKSGFWKGFSLDSQGVAYRSLRNNMKMLRFHDYAIDNKVGDIDKTKIMIYPRYDLGIQLKLP